MTKKASFSWDAVTGADGYHLYFSKFSNPLSYEGTFISTSTTLHNLSANDVINIGVQAFQLQTVNDVERRVLGPVAVVQVDVSDGSSRTFDSTAIGAVTIENE